MAILTIGSTAVANPATFVVERFDLSSEETGRTQAGKAIKDIIARKTKLNMTWNTLTWAQASTLLTAIESSIYLSVTYPDPRTGTYLTKTMYVGDRSSPALMLVSGKEYWGGIAFNLIEQ